MFREPPTYEPCVDIELDHDNANLRFENEPGHASEKPRKSHKSIAVRFQIQHQTVQQWTVKKLAPARKRFERILDQKFEGQTWKFGLFVGFYASLFVIVGNTAMLLVGCFAGGGFKDGIATISQGSAAEVGRTSALYHVLINALSTILLTSSNYAMQLLCAPTREEVNNAHWQRRWLDIGLMSFHNLRSINKKRVFLWAVLALSSAPLHIFFNAAIFQSTTAQDFQIEVVNATAISNNVENWKVLDNAAWSRIYSNRYVSGYGDLRLVVDQASFNVTLDTDWRANLSEPTYLEYDDKDKDWTEHCNWTSWLANTPQLGFAIQLDTSTGTIRPSAAGPGHRLVVNTSDLPTYNSSESGLAFPELKWPQTQHVSVTDEDWVSHSLRLCNTSSWIDSHPFKVQNALAKPVPFGNNIEIALPFILIVIVANLVKATAIFLTLKTCSPHHLTTIGDAISSFLEHPDPVFLGKSTLSKQKLLHNQKLVQVKPWHRREKLLGSVLRGHPRAAVLMLTVSGAATAIPLFSLDSFGKWGTSSTLVIPWTQTAFDTKSILANACLANLPQLLLSVAYFMINRVCTSICTANEWNNYALHRKSLRVTSPRGLQRSTHFLQLPYRWAIPLTVLSGVLHWLLSRSIFLVRVDLRDQHGDRYSDSISACGYSPLSLLCFALIFVLSAAGMLGVIVRRSFKVCIPPAQHCSAVISAACHPPSEDHEAFLKEVQWGVVANASEESEQYCTFASLEVSIPQEGVIYT